MTHRGPGRPTKMPVDELRQRAWSMLAAKKHSGPMPALDTKGQAIFLLLAASYSVQEIAAGLSISENFVRVQKRLITKSIGIAPVRTEKKEKRRSATERSRPDVPDWDINELHALALQLRAAEDDLIVADGDIALARDRGRDYLLPRMRSDVASD